MRYRHNQDTATYQYSCVYIQHTPQRIRHAYDNVFEDKDNTIQVKTPKPSTGENEQYKKLACEQYLKGEIDKKTFTANLSTFDEAPNTKKSTDPAYQ